MTCAIVDDDSSLQAIAAVTNALAVSTTQVCLFQYYCCQQLTWKTRWRLSETRLRRAFKAVWLVVATCQTNRTLFTA
jgi:hypothetical protein